MVLTYYQLTQINCVRNRIEIWKDDLNDIRTMDDMIEDEFGVVFENEDGDVHFNSEQEYTWFLLKWS